MLLKNIIAGSLIFILLNLVNCSSESLIKTKSNHCKNSSSTQTIKQINILIKKNNSIENKHRGFKKAICYYNDNQNDIEAALLLSRAAFIISDLEKDNNKILQFAEIGREASYKSKKVFYDPEISYYFAVNLGLIVRIKGLFAINELPSIEKAFKTSVKRPEIDKGGPLRGLGMLYLKAPSWPRGIGDIDKALALLKRSSTEFSDHPQNHYFYAEALIENENYSLAKKKIKKALSLMNKKKWGKDYINLWEDEISILQKKINDAQ